MAIKTDIEKMVQDEAKKLHQMLYPWHDFDRYPCDAPTGFISIAKHVLKERILARIGEIKMFDFHQDGVEHGIQWVMANQKARTCKLQSQLELLEKETP